MFLKEHFILVRDMAKIYFHSHMMTHMKKVDGVFARPYVTE